MTPDRRTPRLVVTLTANPSLDRTAEIDELIPGEVLRIREMQLDAGGKGVNVARALHAAGVPVRAVLPTGGANGTQLTELLAADGLPVAAVEIPSPIRSNITLVEPGGRTTKINEPGPTLTAATTSALAEAVLRASEGAAWCVLAGSLPPGAGAEFYADLIRALHAQGTQVAVDCDGILLEQIVAAEPDLIKPNADELGAATEIAVTSREAALSAARLLHERGARCVLASLGEDGAILLDSTCAHHAIATAAHPRSTVGAGDATLAGFLAGGGQGPDALRLAVAYGTAAVQLPGTQMPAPGEVHPSAVTVTNLSPERSLS